MKKQDKFTQKMKGCTLTKQKQQPSISQLDKRHYKQLKNNAK